MKKTLLKKTKGQDGNFNSLLCAFPANLSIIASASVGSAIKSYHLILRLSQELKFSIRQIADAIGVSKTSVGEYIAEYKRSGLSYQDVLNINNKELAEIFEKRNKSLNPMYEDLSKEFPYYEKELARIGVTLYLLWEEFKERHPDGFSYSRSCHHYRMWESKLKAGMQQKRKTLHHHNK